MNFKENYQKEMDEVKCTPGLTEMAFQKADRKESNQFHLKSTWKLAFTIMVAACIIGGVTCSDKVAGFAKSIWSSFALSAGYEKIILDSIEPIPFDQETFIADENTQTDEESQDDNEAYYFQTFQDYHAMNNITKLTLPGADKIEYKNIHLTIVPKFGYGRISTEMIYNGNQFEANGMFAIDGFNQQKWGYGENEKVEEIYEYSDEKKAYFVDNDNIKIVYFSEGDILFQLFVKETEDSKAEAKKMLSALSER